MDFCFSDKSNSFINFLQLCSKDLVDIAQTVFLPDKMKFLDNFFSKKDHTFVVLIQFAQTTSIDALQIVYTVFELMRWTLRTNIFLRRYSAFCLFAPTLLKEFPLTFTELSSTRSEGHLERTFFWGKVFSICSNVFQHFFVENTQTVSQVIGLTNWTNFSGKNYSLLILLRNCLKFFDHGSANS